MSDNRAKPALGSDDSPTGPNASVVIPAPPTAPPRKDSGTAASHKDPAPAPHREDPAPHHEDPAPHREDPAPHRRGPGTAAATAAAEDPDAVLRPLLSAMTALRDGDFAARAPECAPGCAGELAAVFNQIAARAQHVSGEMSRMRREVLRHGHLDERLAQPPGGGAWASAVNDANALLDALVTPVADATRVLDAVAAGDLASRVALHDGHRQLRGDRRGLARAVNALADRLAQFTDEVTQVSREVGTAGRLGARARSRDLTGSWRDVTEAVNTMATRLTAQIRDIAEVTTAVANGDLTRTVTVEAAGELLELKVTVNAMVERLSAFADEVTRVAREVGTDGLLGGRAQVRGASGVWQDLTDNVNLMASNLTSQVRSIARVTTAVAYGDLSKKITVAARGEILELKETVNTMVDQLSAFADEVTRVAREVGTEGRLGGQAQVRGARGVWKDLTDNVNSMADNLTSQVRDISQVAVSVAQGDLSKKIDVDARGEILELKTAINTMVDQLSAFADEVTRVAREVGSEGQLGGQARVEGVSGTWKALTTQVNELALNLTTQVRAIGEVASSVASGDMSRTITVAARGEVADLKDNINVMVAHLRETTRAKDWLESNLARLAALMQGHRDLMEVAELILRELTPLVNAQYGAFFLAHPQGPPTGPPTGLPSGLPTGPPTGPASGFPSRLATGLPPGSSAGPPTGQSADPAAGHGTEAPAAPPRLALAAAYGAAQDTLVDAGSVPVHGLVRQAAREQRRILVEEAPPGYITIGSGLGSAAPASVVIIPILFEDRLLGLIELASFSRFSEVHLAFFDQFVTTIGVAMNTIIANARTEELLGESQRLALQLQERSDELQRQQAELRRSNSELAEKATLLATSSRYKSEFLANMSHELRTPLNSLLILARLLADNQDGRLSEQEVQFATTIHRSGSDLLQLINDILDLSKIEAGRMELRRGRLPLIKLLDYVHATFRPLTLDRGLAFEVEVGERVPKEIWSDEQRLQQILRNLLSNAVKFTARGRVELRVTRVRAEDTEVLRHPDGLDLLAFAVHDTGIGIPREQLPVIFEAFQQADGTTHRKYGGTGLGLSISRELAGLLGGRIVAESEPGVGSSFTLYVPLHEVPMAAPPAAASPSGASPSVVSPSAAYSAASRSPSPSSSPSRDEQRAAVAHPEPSAAVLAARAREAEAEVAWPVPTRLEEWRTGPAGRALAGRRILIVDDDIRNVFALTHVLGRVDLTVVYAENGREGIALLEREHERRRPVDLVLMDMMMPDLDGAATIALIRAAPHLATVPVVALTAKAMPGDREQALAEGADAYVPKPVDVDELLTVIHALLDPEGTGADASAATTVPSAPEEPDPPTGPGGSVTDPGQASGAGEPAVPPNTEEA